MFPIGVWGTVFDPPVHPIHPETALEFHSKAKQHCNPGKRRWNSRAFTKKRGFQDMKHMVAINAFGKRVGESHHRAKLTDAEVDTIFELREAGLSYGAIAAKWDDGVTISKSTVRDICTGRIRAQTPDSYRYPTKPPGV